jgi:hypothetical protein
MAVAVLAWSAELQELSAEQRSLAEPELVLPALQAQAAFSLRAVLPQSAAAVAQAELQAA